MSFDVLQDKIRAMKNPTVAGLDARIDYVPEHIRQAAFAEHGTGLEGACEAIYQFNVGLIDALCDIVPAVKPQSAYYENLGWRGMEMLERTIRYAKSKGLFVIADIKRGDIGSTASAYAEGWLSGVKIGEETFKTFDADCVTLNGYMGSDSINPFLKAAQGEDKCVFVLVKTSNPGSGELQDMVAGDRLVYQVMGDLNQRIAKGTEGKYGYTMAGAVTGATYPSDIRALRKRLEHTFFLVPGYGAQGGTAEDVQYAFDKYGHGAIVNSSRGIMCAWQKTGGDGRDFAQAARDAAIAMRDDIRRFVTIVYSSRKRAGLGEGGRTMAKRACVLCGEMAGSWSLCYITLCGTSQTLCEKCMRRYRDAAGEEKIALREYMARSPHLREGEEVRERLPQARVQWQRELEQARERRQQEEQRQAQVKKTARCCGQDMTKLGVSTFQLGEHTFLGGDLDHLLSGSMKMAVFRCEVCGRLKFFDPEWVQ